MEICAVEKTGWKRNDSTRSLNESAFQFKDTSGTDSDLRDKISLWEMGRSRISAVISDIVNLNTIWQKP